MERPLHMHDDSWGRAEEGHVRRWVLLLCLRMMCGLSGSVVRGCEPCNQFEAIHFGKHDQHKICLQRHYHQRNIPQLCTWRGLRCLSLCCSTSALTACCRPGLISYIRTLIDDDIKIQFVINHSYVLVSVSIAQTSSFLPQANVSPFFHHRWWGLAMPVYALVGLFTAYIVLFGRILMCTPSLDSRTSMQGALSDVCSQFCFNSCCQTNSHVTPRLVTVQQQSHPSPTCHATM